MMSPIERLGNRVKAVIVDGFEAVFTWLINVLSWPFLYVSEAIADYLNNKLQVGSYPGQKAAIKLGFDRGVFDAIYDDIQHTSGISRFVMAVLFSVTSMAAIVTAYMSIGARRTQYAFNRVLRNQLISPDEAVAAWFRGLIPEGQMHSIGEAHGFDSGAMNAKQGLFTSIPDFAFLRELVNRGIMSEGDAIRQLQYQGFKPEHAQEISRLFKVIPGVQDLIMMAVREAFSPEIIAQYNLHADFPEEFAQAAEKVGLSREWSLKHWAAHWRLPSVSMGYEMRHRGVIGDADLKLLLRTQDIMPFWRQKLIDISYRTLTRVDVRRMYKLGVLDRSQVKRAYQDAGYNPKNAELMTQFTQMFGTEAERDLTKSDILNGYKRRLFNKSDTIRLLGNLGYASSEARFLTTRVDYDLAETRQKQISRNVEVKFIAGAISENSARTQLKNAGFEIAEVGALMSVWKVKKDERLYMPSIEELKRWFKAKYMSEETFRSELKSQGVPGRYITYYVLEGRG